MNIALWVVQGLLALMFLFTGVSKAFLPLPMVKKNFPFANHMSAGLVRFIGITQLLGGIGLVLPILTGILPWLTVFAAIGLVLTMISAAVYHTSHREFSSIGINVIILLLALFIAIGRWPLL